MPEANVHRLRLNDFKDLVTSFTDYSRYKKITGTIRKINFISMFHHTDSRAYFRTCREELLPLDWDDEKTDFIDAIRLKVCGEHWARKLANQRNCMRQYEAISKLFKNFLNNVTAANKMLKASQFYLADNTIKLALLTLTVQLEMFVHVHEPLLLHARFAGEEALNTMEQIIGHLVKSACRPRLVLRLQYL